MLDEGVNESQIIIELDDEKNEELLEKGKLRTYIENIANDDNLQYYIFIDKVQLADDFVSKTGDIVMNFGGKYFCIHLNAYLPGVTGVSGDS